MTPESAWMLSKVMLSTNFLYITAYAVISYLSYKGDENNQNRFSEYKNQPKHKFDPTEWMKGYRQSLITQVMSGIGTLLILIIFFPDPATSISHLMGSKAAGLVLRYFFTVYCFEIYFDVTHRLLHMSPWLYRMVHKKHHLFKSPVTSAADYMTPLEKTINITGLMGIGLLLGLTPLLMSSLAIVGMIPFLTSHSGYLFDSKHDEHHRLFNVNFGSFSYTLDRLMGTYHTPNISRT